MMNWSGGMGATGWVLMSIFWVILIAAIVWAGAALFGRPDRPGAATIAELPEAILDRRLASGEIDADTYDGLRKKLHRSPVPPSPALSARAARPWSREATHGYPGRRSRRGR